MEMADAYWHDFLRKTGRDAGLRYLECTMFGEPDYADDLLALVLTGQKRATASSLFYYQATGEKPPEPGDYSIITDRLGNPRSVIQTVAVTTLPFRAMSFDVCRREGEDECLETWQQAHMAYFQREGARVGYVFTWNMPVLFEDFKLVYA